MALVVDQENRATGEHRILGVGRLIKLRRRNEAEVAVLVADQHGHGLGTQLLSTLVQIARDENLSRISAEMLRDNLAMHAIIRKLGFTISSTADPSSITAFLDL